MYRNQIYTEVIFKICVQFLLTSAGDKKANGELNAKYPNGIEAQKEKLEAEGHTIIQKGRKNIRYYVKDYENSLFDLK